MWLQRPHGTHKIRPNSPKTTLTPLTLVAQMVQDHRRYVARATPGAAGITAK